MYSRSYPSGNMDIPDRYDGAAIPRSDEEDETVGSDPFIESDADSEPVMGHPSGTGILGGLSLDGLLGGIFQKGKFSLQNIGLEEILIIIAALYMMFSKDGDKECAIMLIILLFIT